MEANNKENRHLVSAEKCKYIQTKLPEYVKGVLSNSEAKEITEHLKDCEKCSEVKLNIINGQFTKQDRSFTPINEGIENIAISEALIQKASEQSLDADAKAHDRCCVLKVICENVNLAFPEFAEKWISGKDITLDEFWAEHEKFCKKNGIQEK